LDWAISARITLNSESNSTSDSIPLAWLVALPDNENWRMGTSPVMAAGSNGRCNAIWYKAVFKVVFNEARETVWAFRGAET
jgi:hypothetical protein